MTNGGTTLTTRLFFSFLHSYTKLLRNKGVSVSFELITDTTLDEEASYTFLKDRNCIRRTAPNRTICVVVLTW
ncbi:hypothetical protein E2C01_093366 [Portunus trituberculatus]|uniref:Uncharacterized protein n=1 Tax=Portunus trituberculatus TaxID=210409 RepID=A0A5B7JY36_PORTR|nr:hypothetical protein [Portunus trituberculatus]